MHPLADRVRAPRRLPGADGACAWARGCRRSSTLPDELRAVGRCRRCCCSRWWKTASSTAWSRRSPAAASRSAPSATATCCVLTRARQRRRPGRRRRRRGTRFGLQQVRERLAHAATARRASAGRCSRRRRRRRHAGRRIRLPLRRRRRMTAPTALIAEDEPLLAEALRAELARAVARAAGRGRSSATAPARVEQALALRPDAVLPRHPHAGPERPGGRAGAGRGLAGRRRRFRCWCSSPPTTSTRCRPSTRRRWTTCSSRWTARAAGAPASPRLQRTLASAPAARRRRCRPALEQLRALLGAAGAGAAGRAAAGGDPGAGRRHGAPGAGRRGDLLRSRRQVRARGHRRARAPDPHCRCASCCRSSTRSAFWQVHRGTVVQARCIASARRDESGKVFLTLQGRSEKLTVSRLYAHLFKGM